MTAFVLVCITAVAGAIVTFHLSLWESALASTPKARLRAASGSRPSNTAPRISLDAHRRWHERVREELEASRGAWRLGPVPDPAFDEFDRPSIHLESDHLRAARIHIYTLDGDSSRVEVHIHKGPFGLVGFGSLSGPSRGDLCLVRDEFPTSAPAELLACDCQTDPMTLCLDAARADLTVRDLRSGEYDAWGDFMRRYSAWAERTTIVVPHRGVLGGFLRQRPEPFFDGLAKRMPTMTDDGNRAHGVRVSARLAVWKQIRVQGTAANDFANSDSWCRVMRSRGSDRRAGLQLLDEMRRLHLSPLERAWVLHEAFRRRGGDEEGAPLERRRHLIEALEPGVHDLTASTFLLLGYVGTQPVAVHDSSSRIISEIAAERFVEVEAELASNVSKPERAVDRLVASRILGARRTHFGHLNGEPGRLTIVEHDADGGLSPAEIVDG